MESLLAIWTQEIWSNRKIGKGWFLPQSFFSKIAPVKLLVLFSFPLPARPRTQHCYHYDTKVKPEAATAVIELLMMGRRTPETCWVVNKRQDNKLKNCCIWLVIYLNCTMMHGLKDKAIPLQAWTGLEGSRWLRLPDFKTIGTWMW